MTNIIALPGCNPPPADVEPHTVDMHRLRGNMLTDLLELARRLRQCAAVNPMGLAHASGTIRRVGMDEADVADGVCQWSGVYRRVLIDLEMVDRYLAVALENQQAARTTL